MKRLRKYKIVKTNVVIYLGIYFTARYSVKRYLYQKASQEKILKEKI